MKETSAPFVGSDCAHSRVAAVMSTVLSDASTDVPFTWTSKNPRPAAVVRFEQPDFGTPKKLIANPTPVGVGVATVVTDPPHALIASPLASIISEGKI
jgi:hypothetical protein